MHGAHIQLTALQAFITARFVGLTVIAGILAQRQLTHSLLTGQVKIIGGAPYRSDPQSHSACASI